MHVVEHKEVCGVLSLFILFYLIFFFNGQIYGMPADHLWSSFAMGAGVKASVHIVFTN